METPTVSKGALWTGRVLSALVVLVFVGGGLFALLKPEAASKGMVQYGYPEHLIYLIGALEVICGLLYAIPHTAVFGAVMLTGYLGGAVATHVRVGEPPIAPIVVAIVLWLGIYLREPRLHHVAPLRK